MDAYAQGFVDKCAEQGIVPSALLKAAQGLGEMSQLIYKPRQQAASTNKPMAGISSLPFTPAASLRPPTPKPAPVTPPAKQIANAEAAGQQKQVQQNMATQQQQQRTNPQAAPKPVFNPSAPVARMQTQPASTDMAYSARNPANIKQWDAYLASLEGK